MRAVANRPAKILVHLTQRGAGKRERTNHIERITLHQYYIGTLHGHVGAGADGEAHVGLRQRGRIVDAVTDHADLVALRLQFFELLRLLSRQYIGKCDVDTEFLADALGGGTIIAGEHGHFHAALLERLDSDFRGRPQCVGDGDEPE